eukprot:CAMPEP_0198516622 /NCGR_PEP_ID=MMETSP1462-20131121/18032_1 /TAXON_ID=1333877 /ORGANISM="Brandtodinium nutriculum, Strain RCC3387" /LENGTH=100 /DNA_ID=CAMNT_0044246153 /DNA_START=21 /DNA_END=320 /DNA_ORIENTATION=+
MKWRPSGGGKGGSKGKVGGRRSSSGGGDVFGGARDVFGGGGSPGEQSAAHQAPPGGGRGLGGDPCDLFVGRLFNMASEDNVRALFASAGLQLRSLKVPFD